VGGESTATLIDEIPGTDQKLYDQAMRQLGKLAGLEEIKREFQELVAVLRINKQRAHLGLSSEPPLSHYIFSGPPGTGKTTVARILGSILKSLGYLSKGQFVETDRAGLIGRYLGETAVKTTKVVEQALGGVLFIDEAYALASKHELDSYSTEAVATLLKLMEDKRKEFVVIAAGYGAEMRTFIESNPGLESRFSQHVQFGSYSAQALTEIFAGFMANSGFLADAETTKGVSRLLEMLKERGTERFGNARVVRVLFDKMTRRQSVRLLKEEGVAEKVRFSTFTFEDIPCEEMLSVSNERLRELVNDPAALSSNEPQVFIDPKIAFRGAFFAN
jgi:SpoVK/Ycf46/Vps4 family AAA+-type ATPase